MTARANTGCTRPTAEARADLQPGTIICNFRVERIESIPEIDGRAYVMRHQSSGTPLMWLANDDENKAFSISFLTPPADDTGVFHILEHSVLCGSQRYPVKEPFVSLLKTSMQTFLNAMTFADKTMYPVASTNEQDLLNLIDVYMDAVLNPALRQRREIFEQEGWHYEMDDVDGPLRYNGVVFNEMKGALSDAEDVALQELTRALFPDTAYGFESGGDPRAIPSLTYEGFLDTHARHYNLSNAKVILYGDLEIEHELSLLDERYLSCAQPAQGSPNPLASQKPVTNLQVVRTMATSPENATVMVGYVLGTYAQRERMLAANVLLDALMGSNEAPLKRALLDADLGSDVDAFLYDGLLQPFVVFELRGARPGRADAFRETLEAELARLVRDGIPRENLEATLESTSFALRERDLGMADGVALAISAMSGWLYDDGMACDYLRFEDGMAHLRDGMEQGLFEDLVRTGILESAHKAQVELVPTDDEGQSTNAALARALDAARAAMGPGELEGIVRHTEELHRLQGEPDTPEALATLPMLRRQDIGEGRPEPGCELIEGTPLPCLYHDVPTRRIVYVYHYFDLHGLAWDELPYVSLLAALLGRLATARHSASELDTLIESRLGRLTFSTAVHQDTITLEPIPRLVVGVSAIEENVADAALIPAEVWSTTSFADHEKIRNVLQQQRLNMEQSFVSSGHTFALGRACAYVSPASLLASHFGSVDYYRFARELLDHFDERAEALQATLEDLCRRVFRADGSLVSFTGDVQARRRFWEVAGDLGLHGADEAGASTRRLVIPQPTPLHEAFVIPSDVCFVAKAADDEPTRLDYHGTWSVAARALNYGYLWDEVRVKGGAYGCGFRAQPNGTMGYYTFRDPNLDASLARFDGASEWLAGLAPDEREMSGYVVSTVAAHDAPKKPRAIALRQDSEFLTRREAGWRERMRGEKLAAQPDELRALAPALGRLAAGGAVCVFGNRSIIESAQADLTVVDLLG